MFFKPAKRRQSVYLDGANSTLRLLALKLVRDIISRCYWVRTLYQFLVSGSAFGEDRLEGAYEFGRAPGFFGRANDQSTPHNLDLQFSASLDAKRLKRFRWKRNR